MKDKIVSFQEIPHTLLAGRMPSHYLYPNELEQIEKGEHNREYSLEDVTYSLNSQGYRCPEFNTTAELKVLSVGCSIAMGEGLPQEMIFSERVSSSIREATQKSVVHWNLGFSAQSNDYCARILHQAVPLLNPELVLVSFTFLFRREHFLPSGNAFFFCPSCPPTWDLSRMDPWNHFKALSSDYDDQLNLYRNFRSICELLSEKKWLFSFLLPSDFEVAARFLDLSN